MADKPIDLFTVPGVRRIIDQVEPDTVEKARRAAKLLADEGVDLEIIDLRSLWPYDWEAIRASVEKTGRLVVAHEASVIGGFGAEVVATVTEKAGYLLETPPVRVGHPDMVWGQAKLEAYSKIAPGDIIDAVRRVMVD